MKIHKKQRDDRGLTLIELIVAVAISAVALGAIWQFLLVSTRSYEAQTAEAELQQEVQQTMNQVQNLLIDTNRAVAYYYEDGASYTALNNDYDVPKEASKRLEIYNNETVAQLVWDKEEQEVVYKETAKENATSTDESKWESAVLAEGVESMAVDVSQVEEKQILKVKMSFVRNEKTYTATRNIVMRNAILNTGNADDIYKEEVVAEKPLIVITNKPNGDKLYPRDDHKFEATVTNATDQTILWTVQGQTCDDTYMNIKTGELVIGALESAKELTVVATLESDRTVNSIYTLTVGDPKAPTVEILDKRGEGEKGETTQTPEGAAEGELVINALCGEIYKIPIKADVNPKDYSHKWTFVSLKEDSEVDAEIFVDRDELGELQEYLIVHEGQVEDFRLVADVVSNEAENGSDTCYVNVIPPVPEIQIEYTEYDGSSDSKPVQTMQDVALYGGSEVAVSVNWSNSVATQEGSFGYSKDALFDENDITWSITYSYEDGTSETVTETMAANEKVTKITKVPFYGVDSIEITATSNKYKNVVFPTRKITVKEPVLELKAYQLTEDGEKSVAPISEGEEQPFYQDIIFETSYVGGRNDNLQWSIILDNSDPIVIGNDKLDLDKGTATLNTTTDAFNGKRMIGCEVTVEVYEKDAPTIKARVSFKVKTPNTCDYKISDKTSLEQALKSDGANVQEYDYLQPNAKFDYECNGVKVGSKYIGNYAFLATIDTYDGEIEIGSSYIQKSKEILTNATDINYIIRAKEQKEENTILFEPQIPKDTTKVDDIQSIIYDVNDKYTGEHVCFVKLNMTLSNYNVEITEKGIFWGTSTVGYAAYYLPMTSENLKKVNDNCDEIEKTLEFCNYYGHDFMITQHDDDIRSYEINATPYKCEYTRTSSDILWWTIKGEWYITVSCKDVKIVDNKQVSTII